jgi:hypothetical protein
MSKKKEVRFEGKIEPLTDCKPFYMVNSLGWSDIDEDHL